MNENMRAEELAYWAAGIDFDGTIGIARTYGKTKLGRRTYHFIRVSISNTKRLVIDAALREFGCGSITTTLTRDGWKTRYIWGVTTNDAVDVLKAIMPYLKLKKEQAKLAIKYHTNKKVYKGRLPGGGYNVTPPEEMQWREECYQKMKVLNKKGVN